MYMIWVLLICLSCYLLLISKYLYVHWHEIQFMSGFRCEREAIPMQTKKSQHERELEIIF